VGTVRCWLALGVTPLRVGQEAYWLDQIARDRCEYYSGKGESPGWWAGALAERTGLTGVAEDEAVRRLFAGQDPQTGEQRVVPLWRTDPRSRLDAHPIQAALRERAASRGVEVSELATGERLRNQLQRISGTRKVSAVAVERVCRKVLDRNPEELYGDAYVEARKHADKKIDARVASFDLSFSDPKSVSLLAAGTSPEVRAEVQAARHVAIRKVLGWLEQEAIGVRRGHNGIDRYRGRGITAAAFDHRTSREGDPQWHTHLLVQNATLGPDGRWSALDSRKLYAHAMTADRLYHAALRAELTRRLDVRWREVDQRTGRRRSTGCMTGTCCGRSLSAAPRSWPNNRNGAIPGSRPAKPRPWPPANPKITPSRKPASMRGWPPGWQRMASAQPSSSRSAGVAAPRPASSRGWSGPDCWMRWPGRAA
jgi:TrwC relaxase